VDEIRNADDQQYPYGPHEWTMPVHTAPDLTAELPAVPAASFWGEAEVPVYDDEPKHAVPKKTRRRIVAGVPWALAAAAVVVALVSATDPFGGPTLAYPSPTAQPAPQPRPAVTRTVRVTAPAVTVHAAPRPAETVYATATATVTKTAAPKPAATVTVTTTKTVTADPAPENEVAP
jgi:hypothetical protein